MTSPFDPHAIAIDALAFIAADEERLSRFIALTGITPSLLREAAQQPDFLSGVLDHMLADESLLVAFASHAGLNPDAIVSAREALSPTDSWDG